MRTGFVLAAGLCLGALLAYSDEAPSLCFDFEDGTLQGWRIVDGAFDRVICDWDFFHNQPDVRYNKQGKYYLNTLEKKDGGRTDSFVGVMESPVFLLQGDRASFRIGGGKHPGAYAALCDEEGREVLRAHGVNSEVMQNISWDVSAWKGRRVFLRIVDQHQGGWGHVTFDDFRAEGFIDEEATQRRFAEEEKRRRQKQVEDAKNHLTSVLDSTQTALMDLMQTFGDDYPHGELYRNRLADYQERLEGLAVNVLDEFQREFMEFRRSVLLDNPLIQRNPILFVVRDQYLPDHHSTATLFQNGEINTGSFRGGGALKVVDLQTGEAETLLDCPKGIIRDPEIHFDGTSVLFSMRRSIEDDYHIYELDLNTHDLRQLTHGAEISDIDPLYLPNDEIVFVSTREPKYCQCNRHIMGNLFKMEADGSNIRQIGRNTLFEGHPSLMPDGVILYDRWEYVDKHFGPAFGLWTVNPDGTNHALYYGNNAWSPGAILDARVIPNTERVAATFGSCHDRPWGAIAIIDRQLGLDGRDPIVYSWPSDIHSYITHNTDYGDGKSRYHPQGGQIDNFTRLPVKYEDPFPLSEKYFLCSRMVEGERMGIFLVDVFGHEICVHEEDKGCFDPMPVQSYQRPPVIPSRVDYSQKTGSLYVADVYIGSGMEHVKRGAVKTLRVVEAPVKLFWTQGNWNLDATQAPAMNFNCTNNKRILGDVPVAEDGSAYFEIPADVYVFFQILDENGMMIQSMRSGTIVRPGEFQGCVGCHENRLTTTVPDKVSKALRRSPSRLKSWYGPPRDFNYLTEVQPVLDRYCVRCHDYGKPAGDVLNLSGDLGLAFNVSYLELRRKSALRWHPDRAEDEKLLVKAVDDGPPEALPPYSWGSHRSRLIDVIRSGHKGVDMDQESLDRIVAWIDLNAPYYGSYASVYRDNVFGRSPLDDGKIAELRKLTGVQVGDISTELQGSPCNFTRPEFSLCLQTLRDKNEEDYTKALAIIREGQKMLAEKPRMDMPGASLLECDRKKLAKYQARINAEHQTQMELLEDRSAGKRH
ncbi:MAG: hypothetical protein ACP5I1_00780 [Candidatus Hinthialibacter sp.]